MDYRVTLFGHSYVGDLSRYGKTKISVNNIDFCLDFIFVPGATFSTFINNPWYFDQLKARSPDFVIVILGGNDIKTDIDLAKNYEDCTKFYNILRERLPSAVIIAAQIENRFYLEGNRFGCPPSEKFDHLRRHFNRFLKNKAFKHCLLQVQGPGRLDDRENYRDRVHLNIVGIKKYFEIIENTLSYAYTKKFVNKL